MAKASHLIVFFDLETTGLDTAKDEIIEFAAAVVGGASFSSLVQLQSMEEIPAEATAIHGIRTQDLAEAPTFDELMEAFARWLNTQHEGYQTKQILLVAHNCFDYDRRILTAACRRANLTLDPTLVFSDSLFAMRRTIKCKSYALSANCEGKQSHRALGDVELLMKWIHTLPESAAFYQVLVEIRQPKLLYAEKEAWATIHASQ